MELTLCPVKIPNNGNKLHMVSGRLIFVRSVKGLNTYYDVNTKIQLCSSIPDKFDYAMELIARRIKEIEVYDGYEVLKT